MIVVDRKTKEEKELNYSSSINFLYKNVFGRVILHIINNRLIAKIVSIYMNSSLSKGRINKTIKRNNIDMTLYEDRKYKSYNDFFTRKKKDTKFDTNKMSFISPCDSKLLVLELDNNSSFNIKGSNYNLKNIVNKDISNEYNRGYALIFRLEEKDYHRYHFIDNGKLDSYTFIKGKLNTVQPITYDKNVFHTNSREYTTLYTENFGEIIEVEVGALLVGKITNNKSITIFNKGDEKGYFEFGGSTIILFVKKEKIVIDKDILENSKQGKETTVSCGEKVGVKYE